MRSVRDQLSGTLGPLAATFRNTNLRRLQLAWVGSLLGTWAYIVALSVYAYGHGGASAVALIVVMRMIPTALVAPLAATLADRFPRRLVMVGADVVRATLMGATAAVIAIGGPAWLVYAIVTISTVAGSPFRPAQAALLPTLARTPAELTAANVASSTLESIGTFLGPAIGGVVLAATNAETVFALNGASFIWSALLVMAIRVAEPATGKREKGHAKGNEFTAGFRTILADRSIALLVALYALQTLVAGALGVFATVAGLRLLHGDSATVGYLNAGVGAGGLAGGFAALALATRGRLAADFGVGIALFGAPLALIGAVPHLIPALLAMVIVGVGNSLVDVSAVTLLQRIVPDYVLARVLGVMWGLLIGSFGVGAFLAPLLIHLFGVRSGLLVAAAILPAAALLTARRLRHLDTIALAPPRVDLLRRTQIFSQLPTATLEALAAKLVEVSLPAGAIVIRAGDVGDRFYIGADGEVEIEGNIFGPGSSFGEIALLRDIPRTATVTARTDVTLYSLERDDFLAAVTQHEASTAAAGAVIARRLDELRADLTTEAGGA